MSIPSRYTLADFWVALCYSNFQPPGAGSTPGVRFANGSSVLAALSYIPQTHWLSAGSASLNSLNTGIPAPSEDVTVVAGFTERGGSAGTRWPIAQNGVGRLRASAAVDPPTSWRAATAVGFLPSGDWELAWAVIGTGEINLERALEISLLSSTIPSPTDFPWGEVVAMVYGDDVGDPTMIFDGPERTSSWADLMREAKVDFPAGSDVAHVGPGRFS